MNLKLTPAQYKAETIVFSRDRNYLRIERENGSTFFKPMASEEAVEEYIEELIAQQTNNQTLNIEL